MIVPMSFPTPSPTAVAALAPTGTLRAAINLSNFLLVTGKGSDGNPEGVSPDMARALADRLGVGLQLVRYKTPGALADAAPSGAWDVGNIGAEPARAESIAFTAAYCEIEATYLVPAESTVTSVDEVDRPGMRIASTARSAYGLWLERNIRHAELIEAQTLDGAMETFVADGLDALAGLRPRLISDVERLPGARLLEGCFTSVQQAMGTPRGRDEEGIRYLEAFVEAAKASGVVAGFIERHGVRGLSVAGPA
jgi:polar amino acid transport system substrate-binding protein